MNSFKRFWQEDSINECFDDQPKTVVGYQKVQYPHHGYSTYVTTVMEESIKRGCQATILVACATHECGPYLQEMYPGVTFVDCPTFADGLNKVKQDHKVPISLVLRQADVQRDNSVKTYLTQVTEAFNANVSPDVILDETPNKMIARYDTIISEGIKSRDPAKIGAITGLDELGAKGYIQYYR